MDQGSGHVGDDPIVVTGLGHCLRSPGDQGRLKPQPYLKIRKTRKFMGVQDDLAVLAAGEAISQSGLEKPLGDRCGLYLAVGFIPFEQDDLESLYEGSKDEDGQFSIDAFSSKGLRSVSPLLTFRCLPNMPAFHVSMNFGIEGPYLTTYPGPGQFYSALDEAVMALEEDLVDQAVLGGVAHQQNYLVEHLFARFETSKTPAQLCDAAGFLILEKKSKARERGRSWSHKLLDYRIDYRPHHPFERSFRPRESFASESTELTLTQTESGPATLPLALTLAQEDEGVWEHQLETRDGFVAKSRWERG
ncbi:MAG: beta-ketoacyl synthase N-terminal-like domain-containing protein [Planctomycetota bacterium]|nr:beta-ketoacyl synthase N-terminal-like domain-containing protein [Planctomycetota bacterium]